MELTDSERRYRAPRRASGMTGHDDLLQVNIPSARMKSNLLVIVGRECRRRSEAPRDREELEAVVPEVQERAYTEAPARRADAAFCPSSIPEPYGSIDRSTGR